MNIKETLKRNIRKAIEKKIENGNPLAPLYTYSEYWNGARPVALDIDPETLEVFISYQYEDSTPVRVYNGEIIRVYFPATWTKEELERFIEDDTFLTLLTTHVKYPDEGVDTGSELGRYIDDYNLSADHADIIDVGDFFADTGYDYESFCTNVWPPNLTLEEAVEQIEELAQREGYILEGDIEAYLTQKVEMFDTDEVPLRGYHRALIEE